MAPLGSVKSRVELVIENKSESPSIPRLITSTTAAGHRCAGHNRLRGLITTTAAAAAAAAATAAAAAGNSAYCPP